MHWSDKMIDVSIILQQLVIFKTFVMLNMNLLDIFNQRLMMNMQIHCCTGALNMFYVMYVIWFDFHYFQNHQQVMNRNGGEM